VTTTHDSTQKADIARGHAQDAAQDAKARAAEVGSHANAAAQDVASTAVDQAQNVQHETVRQARNFMSEATDQLSVQAGTQTQRMSGNLRELGNELRQMATAGTTGGTASELAHQAADRAHQVAGYLEGREPGEILEDLRSYARRRPGAFLAGAAVLGLIVGRVGRGVKDAPSTSTSTSQLPSATATTPVYSQYGELSSPQTGGSYISETPYAPPPGESFTGTEAMVSPAYEEERTVDLTEDYETSLIEPHGSAEYGDSEMGRR